MWADVGWRRRAERANAFHFEKGIVEKLCTTRDTQRKSCAHNHGKRSNACASRINGVGGISSRRILNYYRTRLSIFIHFARYHSAAENRNKGNALESSPLSYAYSMPVARLSMSILMSNRRNRWNGIFAYAHTNGAMAHVYREPTTMLDCMTFYKHTLTINSLSKSDLLLLLRRLRLPLRCQS